MKRVLREIHVTVSREIHVKQISREFHVKNSREIHVKLVSREIHTGRFCLWYAIQYMYNIYMYI